MKITDVRPVPVWGGTHRNYMFVVVDTDEGVRGVGEAGLTGQERAVCGAVQQVRDLLVGEDTARIEHIWQMLSRGSFFPAERVMASAIGAIDIALWDILGKTADQPVFNLLGGRTRDFVTCYGHVPSGAGVTDSDVVEAVARMRDIGWRAVRLELPASPGYFEPRSSVRLALRRLDAIRNTVGDDIDVILDVHTRLDPPEATWLCREIEQYHPLFVEDPLRAENLDSYRRLRQATGVPLAAGEQLCSKWEFGNLIEHELVDYARVDLCIAGGLSEARKIAALCETHHVLIAPHNPQGPVSTAAATHFCLSTTPFGILEVPPRHGAILTDVVTPQPGPDEYSLKPPDGIGLGVDFDEAAAKRHPPQWVGLPQLARNDGAFTNW